MKQGILLALFVFVTGVAASAPTDRYEELTGDQDDFEASVKEWKEALGEIPPFPDDDAWKQVEIDVLPENQRAYLDMENLNVSEKDFVVRYWLLIRSSAGAFTATYEGLRCSSKEYVIYAYGDPRRDPVVRKVKKPKWREYGRMKRGNYRGELAQGYFCTGEIPRERYQIEQAVKGLFESHNPFDNWTNDD
ncbi:CNP1-like family protein [Thiolapillus sp.]